MSKGKNLIQLFSHINPSNFWLSLQSFIWISSAGNLQVTYFFNRVFSHDITAAILVSQNNETAAMLVSQTGPLGVELFSYANAFFCSNKFA